MKIKLIGIQPQDYTLDSGYSFKGRVLHVIDLVTKADKQIGHQILKIKLPDEHPSSSLPLTIGSEYEAFFNPKGQLDVLFVPQQK